MRIPIIDTVVIWLEILELTIEKKPSNKIQSQDIDQNKFWLTWNKSLLNKSVIYSIREWKIK